MGITDSTRSTTTFTDGLRALADILDEAGIDDRLGHCHMMPVKTREEMLAVTRLLGGKWDKDYWEGSHWFGLTRKIGGGVSIQVYTARENVCTPTVVGKRTVTRPAPDAPTVQVEEDVVEWVCPPSILAEARP